MTTNEERRHTYLRQLRSLVRSQDRGALADLRADLRGQPADRYRAGKHVVPYLGDTAHEDDAWFYLVGGLFALHPMDNPKMGNFGESLRPLRKDSDSVDLRVLALLDAPREDVARHLRSLVGQLASKGYGVNWERLLDDLCYWGLPDRPVQECWARSYYRKTDPAAAAATDDTKGNENEG